MLLKGYSSSSEHGLLVTLSREFELQPGLGTSRDLHFTMTKTRDLTVITRCANIALVIEPLCHFSSSFYLSSWLRVKFASDFEHYVRSLFSFSSFL